MFEKKNSLSTEHNTFSNAGIPLSFRLVLFSMTCNVTNDSGAHIRSVPIIILVDP